MKIEDVKNGSYDLKGNLKFETSTEKLSLKVIDALEIAYTLFDWAGTSYDILEKIRKKMEEE